MTSAQYRAMAHLEDAHFWFVGKRAYIGVMFDQFRLGGRILDIGCGTGGTTRFLGRYGKAVGVERSALALRLARKRGIRLQRGSANFLSFARDTFDVVTFFDVLYHKRVTIAAALSHAFRVLKPGGTLVVTDCVHPRLWSAHDAAMHARERFTKRRLESVVTSAGFRIRRSSYLFAVTFLLFVGSRLLMRWKKPGDFVRIPPKVINEVLIVLLRLEAAIFRYVNLPLGSSVLIVAEKT